MTDRVLTTRERVTTLIRALLHEGVPLPTLEAAVASVRRYVPATTFVDGVASDAARAYTDRLLGPEQDGGES